MQQALFQRNNNEILFFFYGTEDPAEIKEHINSRHHVYSGFRPQLQCHPLRKVFPDHLLQGSLSQFLSLSLCMSLLNFLQSPFSKSLITLFPCLVFYVFIFCSSLFFLAYLLISPFDYQPRADPGCLVQSSVPHLPKDLTHSRSLSNIC